MLLHAEPIYIILVIKKNNTFKKKTMLVFL